MAIVVRLIIFEGTEEGVNHQLGNSMADGVRQSQLGQCLIRAITLPPAILTLLGRLAQELKAQETTFRLTTSDSTCLDGPTYEGKRSLG